MYTTHSEPEGNGSWGPVARPWALWGPSSKALSMSGRWAVSAGAGGVIRERGPGRTLGTAGHSRGGRGSGRCAAHPGHRPASSPPVSSQAQQAPSVFGPSQGNSYWIYLYFLPLFCFVFNFHSCLIDCLSLFHLTMKNQICDYGCHVD